MDLVQYLNKCLDAVFPVGNITKSLGVTPTQLHSMVSRRMLLLLLLLLYVSGHEGTNYFRLKLGKLQNSSPNHTE